MVPILVATQELYHSTYVVSHIVDHNARKLHQANEVLLPPEGPFLCTKYLREIVQNFWMFLIDCCTL